MADGFATYEDLGKYLSDMIDGLEEKRLFAGDLEAVFDIPLEGGEIYRCAIARVVNGVSSLDHPAVTVARSRCRHRRN